MQDHRLTSAGVFAYVHLRECFAFGVQPESLVKVSETHSREICTALRYLPNFADGKEILIRCVRTH